jgi:hypothetical protein
MSIERFGKSMYAPIAFDACVCVCVRAYTTQSSQSNWLLVVSVQTVWDGKRDRGTGTKTRASLSATPTSASSSVTVSSNASAKHSLAVEVRHHLLLAHCCDSAGPETLTCARTRVQTGESGNEKRRGTHDRKQQQQRWRW